MPGNGLRHVLFDLDGTLVDTAPDLAGAVNSLRQEEGFAPMPFSQLRPVCSQGARGLLAQAFGVLADDPAFDRLRARFLALYGERVAEQSSPFPGIPELLKALHSAGIQWGIVTNKPRAYAEPLVHAMGWNGHAGALVAGDDTPHPKPAPDPILLACKQLGLHATDGLYVGDDPRDVLAAQAVPMRCAAVSWGYVEHAPPLKNWGADSVFDDVESLRRHLLSH